MVLRTPVALLLALTACGKEPTIVITDDYGLQLTPLLTDAPDPFASGAELSILVSSGGVETLEELGSSPDQTWSLPEFPPLDAASVRLMVTDPGGQVSPLDYDDLRASGLVGPVSLAEGELDLPILMTPYAALGGMGRLTGGQVSFGSAVAMLSGGEVLLFGGAPRVLNSRESDVSARHVLQLSLEDGDLAFERVGDLPEVAATTAERVGATATVVMHEGIEQVLVVGGREDWTPPTKAASHAFLWNPTTHTVSWTAVGLVGRSEHVAIPRADGRVFVMGGLDGTGKADFLSFDIWTPGSVPSFTAGPAPVEDRIGAVGFGWADLGDDGIILCGGGRQRTGETAFSAQKTCQRINNNGIDGAVHDLPAARQYLAMAPTLGGKILVTGGVEGVLAESSTREASSSAWLLDPTRGVAASAAWEEVGPMVSPRAMHRAVPLADGRVLLVGGVTDAFGRAPASVGDTVPCPEIFDPDDRTFTLLEHCPAAGLGGLAAITSAEGRGTFVLAGVHEDGGGDAFGIIGQGL